MVKKLITVLFLFFVGSLFSQLPYFTSLNQQLLSTNPAFAGSNKELRIQSMANTRFPNSRDIYNSYYLGADILLGKFSGLGISAYHTDCSNGLLRETQVSISYALHLTIKGKLKIVPSIQASYLRLDLDRSRLTFEDMYGYSNGCMGNSIFPGSSEVSISQSKQNADFALGVLVYKENFYFSASVLSPNQPDVGLMGRSIRRATLIHQGGYNFKFGTNWTLSPYGFIKLQYSNAIFLQYGTYIGYNCFKLHLANRIGGSYYNANYGVVAGFNFKIRNFKVGCNALIYLPNQYSNLNYSYEAYLSFNAGNWKKKTDVKPDVQTPQAIKIGDW